MKIPVESVTWYNFLSVLIKNVLVLDINFDKLIHIYHLSLFNTEKRYPSIKEWSYVEPSQVLYRMYWTTWPTIHFFHLKIGIFYKAPFIIPIWKIENSCQLRSRFVCMGPRTKTGPSVKRKMSSCWVFLIVPVSFSCEKIRIDLSLKTESLCLLWAVN